MYIFKLPEMSINVLSKKTIILTPTIDKEPIFNAPSEFCVS